MAAMCLKKILDHTVRNETSITRYFASFMVQPVKWTVCAHYWRDRPKKELISASGQAFCTYEDEEDKSKGKKRNPNARNTIGSVGRKIPHRIIQLIDENGENQGTMHRADVIRILDERGVKLVPLKEAADPPVYKLMSGPQIHEERMKLREKQKASSKTVSIQQKELTFSTAIGQHDLDTKTKQIEQWINKKHHVRINLHQKNVAEGPEKMLKFFDLILETMPEKATYLSEPRVVKEGRSTCVLRHMSDKEIQQHRKMEKDKAQTDGGNETTDSDVLRH